MASPSLWVFGNLLPYTSSIMKKITSSTPIFMVESERRARRYPYHKKKLVFVFSAMRHFAAAMENKGMVVDYYNMERGLSFREALEEHVDKHESSEIFTLHPTEYPHLMGLKKLERQIGMKITLHDNDLFFLDLDDFKERARGKRRIIMESFYRRQRKSLDLLMNGDGNPAGGRWNYDKKNRKGYTPGIHPKPIHKVMDSFKPDDITRAVMRAVESTFQRHPGITENFLYPVTRADALVHLHKFAEHRLDLFGPYEDMMARGHDLVFHSLLSPLLNTGLLHPREVIETVLERYQAGEARVQSVEAMVRQVTGWREFIYGAYWEKMPRYRESNFLCHYRPLPDFFWTGNTRLACLEEVITQVLDTGFAHHIQRLMVIANFCTLAGIVPDAVLHWFMAMFIDAFDWVMYPNVHGMGIFADGGFISTKPYISSGAYINRMSDYCKECTFQVKKKTGKGACPFNYLYWNFLDANREKLGNLNRLMLMYRQLDKKGEDELDVIRKDAKKFLNALTEKVIEPDDSSQSKGK